MTWGTAIQRKTPMRRFKADRSEGLGRKVEIAMGFYRPEGHKLPALLRSEKHRRNVAALPCACCGRQGPSQAAHANTTKGMGIKACDSLVFPLCPACHRELDQGGSLVKATRRNCEWVWVDSARAELMALGQWTAEVEMHYQRAVEPLRRLVKGDDK